MFFLREVAASTLLTLCVLITAIVLEHVGPVERLTLRERLPGFVINSAGTILALTAAYPLHRFWETLGVAPFVTIPLWQWLAPMGTASYALQAAVLVIFADFLAYCRHRADHAWFWRLHVVHHSPTKLHAANDIAHPAQVILDFVFIGVPMSLIHISGPGTPFVVAGAVLLASMLIHSPVEWHLGPLRLLVVDNRFHRIHHSIEQRHFDKNFGIFLSIWDRIFGTAYDPGEEWPQVGVEGVRPPATVMEYLRMPVTGGRADRETSAGHEDGQASNAAAFYR